MNVYLVIGKEIYEERCEGSCTTSICGIYSLKNLAKDRKEMLEKMENKYDNVEYEYSIKCVSIDSNVFIEMSTYSWSE